MDRSDKTSTRRPGGPLKRLSGASSGRDQYPQIWAVVRQIPAGQVASYGQIAALAGLPGRARLVGRALGEALESDALPWHRVVNAQGLLSLPRSSSAWLEQRARLTAEGLSFRNDRVDLGRHRWRPQSDSPLLD